MLTPAGDIAAFADAIARLLGDAPLRRSMSRGRAALRVARSDRSRSRRPGWRRSSRMSGQAAAWLTIRPGSRFTPSSIAGSNAGRVADLWLRDDDAVEPTAALDRLLDL